MEEEQEEITDPQNELIQNLFNKAGYKANFKKVIEAINSGSEFVFPFISYLFFLLLSEILNTLIESVFTVLNSLDEYSPDTKLHSLRVKLTKTFDFLKEIQ